MADDVLSLSVVLTTVYFRFRATPPAALGRWML
jgi:hypothetical protein